MKKKPKIELFSEVFQALEKYPHLLDDSPTARKAVKRMFISSAMVARASALHAGDRSAKQLAIAIAKNRKAKGQFCYYSDVIPDIKEAIRKDTRIARQYLDSTIKKWIRAIAPDTAKKQGRRTQSHE